MTGTLTGIMSRRGRVATFSFARISDLELDFGPSVERKLSDGRPCAHKIALQTTMWQMLAPAKNSRSIDQSERSIDAIRHKMLAFSARLIIITEYYLIRPISPQGLTKCDLATFY